MNINIKPYKRNAKQERNYNKYLKCFMKIQLIRKCMSIFFYFSPLINAIKKVIKDLQLINIVPLI